MIESKNMGNRSQEMRPFPHNNRLRERAVCSTARLIRRCLGFRGKDLPTLQRLGQRYHNQLRPIFRALLIGCSAIDGVSGFEV